MFVTFFSHTHGCRRQKHRVFSLSTCCFFLFSHTIIKAYAIGYFPSVGAEIYCQKPCNPSEEQGMAYTLAIVNSWLIRCAKHQIYVRELKMKLTSIVVTCIDRIQYCISLCMYFLKVIRCANENYAFPVWFLPGSAHFTNDNHRIIRFLTLNVSHKKEINPTETSIIDGLARTQWNIRISRSLHAFRIYRSTRLRMGGVKGRRLKEKQKLKKQKQKNPQDLENRMLTIFFSETQIWSSCRFNAIACE